MLPQHSPRCSVATNKNSDGGLRPPLQPLLCSLFIKQIIFIRESRRKYEISSPEKILMIPRNEETNSEILLQFFPVTWAKYFYDELVCQSLGSTLLVFVSNFPSFMSIGRKQHNGYQLLTFLLLTALTVPAAGEIKMSTLVQWIRSSQPGNSSQLLVLVGSNWVWLTVMTRLLQL